MELMKTIPSGNNQGEIGNDLKAPLDNGPKTIAFDKSGNLYISDIINDRLVKFDKTFNYKEEFKNTYSGAGFHLLIDENNNFIIDYSDNSYAMEDSKFTKIFFLDLHKSPYKNKIIGPHSYVYKDNTIFTKLNDGSIISIPNPDNDNNKNMKNILDFEKTKKYIQKNKMLYLQIKQIKDKNNKIIKENHRIIINDEIQTQEFNDYYEFHKEKRDNNKSLNINKTKPAYLNKYTDENILNLNDMHYLGKDIDKNVYWLWRSSKIYIFNKNGDIIEAFTFDWQKSKIFFPAMHPSGDVYLLDYDGKANYLYRIKRVW